MFYSGNSVRINVLLSLQMWACKAIGRARAAAFVEQRVEMLSLSLKCPVIGPSPRHRLDFLKPENRAERSLLFSQTN